MPESCTECRPLARPDPPMLPSWLSMAEVGEENPARNHHQHEGMSLYGRFGRQLRSANPIARDTSCAPSSTASVNRSRGSYSRRVLMMDTDIAATTVPR